MKKIALCFTFVLIISTGAFAGPPGMSLSEVNSKENQAAFTENNKEAPDIGAIGSSVMIASNYLKEDERGAMIANKKEKNLESTVTESTPKYGCATTVKMNEKNKERNNPNDEGVPARLTDFEMTSVISNSIKGKEDAPPIVQKE